MNPWGCVLRDLRRLRRRTASVERITTVGVVRHLRCRRLSSPLLHFSTSPRVRPSGITRGYAWCVPSGDSGCRLGGFFFLSLSILPLHFFTSSLLQEFTLRASPAVTHGVSPPGTVGAGWEVSLFSPSPLLHFSTSPRVHPSGITRGYAWCVPSGDSGGDSHHKKFV